ncbi:MAG: PGF-pre-PGF domain-containing protein, partial [Candidatus Methanoperedens sp.]|nr:PGF-pre-PGF domain-containing protein [Candidatus Methanoperedens sp.]
NLTATDTSSNSIYQIINITVQDATPPVWNPVPSDQIIELGTGFGYDVNATDLSPIAYGINGIGNFAIDSTSGLITNTTSLNVGIYDLNLTATDTSSNSIYQIINITVQDATPPVWNPVPSDQIIELGTGFSYDVNATDAEPITYGINGIGNFAIDSATGLITNTTSLNAGIFDLNLTASDAGSNIIFHVINISVRDTSPPSGITDLMNVSYAPDYINWTWTDPSNPDLKEVMIYLNGAFQTNVPGSVRFYRATGLNPDTNYEISTRTVDLAGNINSTWVNHTANTAPSSGGGGGGGGSSGGSGAGDGGGGSGGGSGSITSSEPFDNIEVTERYVKDLIANTPVVYNFIAPEHGIYEIVVTGKENEYFITMRIEALKGTSRLVNIPPPGNVYKNMNIWAGSQRIKEALIRFKVNNSWLSDNKLGSDDVKMVKWDGYKWIQLDTTKIKSDSIYTYYEAYTVSFSPFAITARSVISPAPAPAPVRISRIIPESPPFRFNPTHMIVKPVNCLACHIDEFKDLENGRHIWSMNAMQDRFLYDYLAVYGNVTEPENSLQGPCYSCHVTFNAYDQYGLTDPYLFRKSDGSFDAQYGYIIKWGAGRNPVDYFGTGNIAISVELEATSISPSNSTIESTLKILLSNYSGQQTVDNSNDNAATLHEGEKQTLRIENIIEDYFNIILILDGAWNNAFVRLKVEGTDKGTEYFDIEARNPPVIYNIPDNTSDLPYFKTNGTYKAERFDYISNDWLKYSIGNIATSEVIMTNSTGGWISQNSCSAPDALCHINQKITYMGLSDNSLYTHNMQFVTIDKCKICHLGGTYSNCLGCHQSQQGVYPAIDTASFSMHKNANTADGINVVSNSDCQTCHYDTSNMMQSGFTVGTLTCTDCHNGNFNAPTIYNHRPGGISIAMVASCSTCHINTIDKYIYSDTASISHYSSDVTNIASTPYQHSGPINTSDCIECHNGPYTNNVSWGSPVDISTSTRRQHNETLTGQCDLCHNDGKVQSLALVDFHNASVVRAGGSNAGGSSSLDCLGCHQSQQGVYPAIDTTSFSVHENVNKADGINNLANSDCQACHYDTSNMMQPGFTVGTRNCIDCHTGNGNYNAPVVYNHIPDGISVKTTAYCSACHNNTINRYIYSENASVSHYVNYVTDISTTPYQHSGPINTSDCAECHKGPYTGNMSWGSPVDISISTKRQHNETRTDQCDLCHNNGRVPGLESVDFHNASITTGSGDGCIGCHADIANSFFGKHNNVNTTDGTGILSNDDCKGCHFSIPIDQMKNGYANFSNTYFCQDCHTSGGRNPAQYAKIINATLRKTAMPPGHAHNKCEQCHVAGDDEQKPLIPEYRYHTNGPSGTAAGKNCFSCHYRSDGAGSGGANIGLNDRIFNAPGESHNCLLCHGPKAISPAGRPVSCSMCHTADDNHDVTIGNHNGRESTAITGLSITSPVTAGGIATINATVTSTFTQIARAQYRVNDTANNIIMDWTDMNASDGQFDESTEQVTGYIDTRGLSGNYIVSVRGMSSAATGSPPGGMNHDPGRFYYPDNAVWTNTIVMALEVR